MKQSLLILFSVLSLSLLSQERNFRDDTVSIRYSNNTEQLRFKKMPYYEMDGFQNYRPFGNYHGPLSRSGNIGLPLHYYFLGAQDWNINHQLGGYQPWLMEKDSMLFYDVSRPFTELKYFNGAKKEQLFNVLHTQNFGEGLNISFEYQRIVSEGYFSRQLTNHTQFNTTYRLNSRNQRFHSRGYFLINNLESQENGGIVVSTDESAEENTVLLDIGLQDAQNRSRTQGVGFYNDYNLIQKDSITNILNISHEIEWSKADRNYADDLSESRDFYDEFLIDSIFSADSNFSQVLRNNLLLNFFNQSISLGVRNEQYHYFQNYLIDETFESNYIVASINDSLFNQGISASLEKGISGYHKNELDMSTTISFQEWKGIRNYFMASVTRKQADYFLQNQRSNHSFYREDFNTSNQANLSLRSHINKWNLSVEAGIQQYSDFIYFDTLIKPKQYNLTFSNLFVKLDFKLEFLRHMNLKNVITVQQISDDAVVPLPSIFSYHSLFYENNLINNALGLQLGVDLNFIGTYGGYEYAPSLTQFHLSSNSTSLGNIAQVDVFLNLRINKAARLFVKMENILEKSFSEESYRIHGYPIPGKSLKFGLSWRMIN
ncbi:MAG: putative porin [Vicingaceae bacterium]